MHVVVGVGAAESERNNVVDLIRWRGDALLQAMGAERVLVTAALPLLKKRLHSM